MSGNNTIVATVRVNDDISFSSNAIKGITLWYYFMMALENVNVYLGFKSVNDY